MTTSERPTHIYKDILEANIKVMNVSFRDSFTDIQKSKKILELFNFDFK